MKRGDLYTTAIGFGGKPRPVLIVQADAFSDLSKRLMVLIGRPVDGASAIRVPVESSEINNLRAASEVMIDTILPVRSNELGVYTGRVSSEDMRRVDTALMLFFGLAG